MEATEAQPTQQTVADLLAQVSQLQAKVDGYEKGGGLAAENTRLKALLHAVSAEVKQEAYTVDAVVVRREDGANALRITLTSSIADEDREYALAGAVSATVQEAMAHRHEAGILESLERLTTRTYGPVPDAFTGNLSEVQNLALSLCSEAGEVAGKIRNLTWHHEADVDDILKETLPAELLTPIFLELGDVFWSACRISRALGSTPLQIIDKLMDKLEARLEAGTIKGEGDDR